MAKSTGVALAATTSVIWGGQWVVGKSALARVDAFNLTTIRYAVAATVLLAILAASLHGAHGIVRLALDCSRDRGRRRDRRREHPVGDRRDVDAPADRLHRDSRRGRRGHDLEPRGGEDRPAERRALHERDAGDD